MKRPASASKRRLTQAPPASEAESIADSDEGSDGAPLTTHRVMFFVDSRNVGRSIYRSLLQGLHHGHLLEFLVYDDKFAPSSSGMGHGA